MATIRIVIQSATKARADARVIASELAGALSNLGLDVTLASGMPWPAHDGDGRDAVTQRFERLANVACMAHEISVEIAH